MIGGIGSYKSIMEKDNITGNTIDEEKNQYFIDNVPFELYLKLKYNDSQEISEKYQINTKKSYTYACNPKSFKNLVASDIYVDKSLFIKEIIDSSSAFMIITRPRRWGKTLNLDMLKTFLEIEVNDEGEFNPDSYNKSIAFFKGGSVTIDHQEIRLKELNISKLNRGEYLIRQGKYPVIFITFTNITRDTQADDKLFKSIRSSISKAYECHTPVLNGLQTKLDQHCFKIRKENQNLEKEDITEILERKTDNERINILKFKRYLYQDPEADLEDSIYFLCKILYEYYQREVYILIDEYDAPLNSSFGTDHYDKIKDLIKSIFKNSMKITKYVNKAILSGILKMARADIFSGLNNITEYDILGLQYSEFFGFTEQEVNKLLDRCLVINNPQDRRQYELIKMCYNGYKIRDYTIYNPWSIMMCLDRAKKDPLNALQAYWVDSGSFEIIEKSFRNLKNTCELKSLVKNCRIKYCIPANVDYNHLNQSLDAFVSLLFYSGYLTKIKNNEYRIPNLEVMTYFYSFILHTWLETDIGSKDTIDRLFNTAINNIEDGKAYKNIIETQLLTLMKHNEKTESDFKILLGAPSVLAFASQQMMHAPYSEVHTKYQKKIDAIFLPLEGKSNSVIIHEYKKAPNEGKIDEIIEEAIWQIYVNQYISKPILEKKRAGVRCFWKTIIVRAIVFFKRIEGSWGLEIKEFIHGFKEAEKINNIFSYNGGLLPNIKELLNQETVSAASDSRKEFLLKNKAEGIFELIQKYSTKSFNYQKKKDFSDILESSHLDKDSRINDSDDEVNPHKYSKKIREFNLESKDKLKCIKKLPQDPSDSSNSQDSFIDYPQKLKSYSNYSFINKDINLSHKIRNQNLSPDDSPVENFKSSPNESFNKFIKLPNKSKEKDVKRKSARLAKIRLLKQAHEIESGVPLKRKKSNTTQKSIKR